MECPRIRPHLSAYLDGVLDAQTTSLVREHVAACKKCRQTLESLRSLVQELGELERIKAPDDFLEQIHSRMAKQFDFRALMRTLSIPFRIKIPYQLAAVAATAILIFIIVRTPYMEKKLTDIPELKKPHESAERVNSNGIPEKPLAGKNLVATHDVKSTQITEQHSEAPPTVALQRIEPSSAESKRDKRPAKSQLREKTYLRKSAAQKANSKKLITKKVKPLDLVLILQPEVLVSNGSQKKEGVVDIMSLSEKGQALEFSGSEHRAVPSSSPRTMEREHFYEDQSVGFTAEETLKVKEAAPAEDLPGDDSLSGIKDRIKSIKGNLLSTEYDENSGQPKYVNAEIPAEHYVYFCESLQQLGPLQYPTPVTETEHPEYLRIRIRLIPPPHVKPSLEEQLNSQ